jgi:DNA-binding response OmpR family regulator
MERPGNQPLKLLIVDTEQSMLDMLASWLKSLGYEVLCAFTEEELRTNWIEKRPDLIITNSRLNTIDILPICRALQLKSDALILVLDGGTAPKDDVRYLEGGADDYMRKPFYPDQLLAHIHALSRRMRGIHQAQSRSTIQAGALSIDLLHNEVRIRKRTVRLTPTESKILHLLASNAGRVCTQSQIVNYVWEYPDAEVAALIKPHIYNLRQKIEANPQRPHYILTIPNTGYMLVNESDDETTPVSEHTMGG